MDSVKLRPAAGHTGWLAELAKVARLPAGKPDPGDPQLPGYLRPLLEGRAVAVEVVPQAPRVRTRMITPGSGVSMAEAGKAFLQPPQQRLLSWYCWEVPDGFEFRPGKAGAGLSLVEFVPAQGTRIRRDGAEFRVGWSFAKLGHELAEMPMWLASVLGRRRS